MNPQIPDIACGAEADVATPPRAIGAAGVAGGGRPAALGAADWLSLAAAPTFAMMALSTVVLGGGPPDILCSAGQGAFPLSGMVPMYLLMSVFHLAAWIRLVGRHRPSTRFRSIEADAH